MDKTDLFRAFRLSSNRKAFFYFMGYEKIDDALNSWSKNHNLHLHKIYQEQEVRSFELTDNNGNRYQLWIDEPDKKEQINIHIWDFRKRMKTFLCEEIALADCLETVYLAVNNWILG